MSQTVKAIKTGTYPGNVIRRPGDVFEIAKSEHFSERWMEKLTKSEASEMLEADEVLQDERLHGASVSPRYQSAAEVESLKNQAAVASQTGREVAPPDPRAAVATASEKDGKAKNRRI